MVTFAKQCPPFPKPMLFKLALEQLLKVFGFQCIGRGKCVSKCNIMDGER
jgi:hypothetical protein